MPGKKKRHGKGASPGNSPQRDRDGAARGAEAGPSSPGIFSRGPSSPERDRSPHHSPKGSPGGKKGKKKSSHHNALHGNSANGSNASASNIGNPSVNSAARRSPHKQYNSQSSGSSTPISLGFTPSPPKSPLKRPRAEHSENVNDIQELDHHGSVSRISPQGPRVSPGKMESTDKAQNSPQKNDSDPELAPVSWLFGNDKKSAKNEKNVASAITGPEVPTHDTTHFGTTTSRKREHSLSRSPGHKRTRTDDVSDVISDLDRVQVQSASSSSSQDSASVEGSASRLTDEQNDSVVIVDSPHVTDRLEERRIARARRTGI